MKKIFFILATILTFTACSSDDDNGVPNGGDGNGGTNTSGGNSWTNPAKRTSIPADQFTGKWVFDKYSYDVQADDAKTKASIIAEMTSKTEINDLYPKVGFFNFYPKAPVINIYKMYAEGSMRWNYEDKSSKEELFGDYFSNQDTIFYYHWTLKTKYHYMLKKGDRLYYHYDDTNDQGADHPNGGVKKAIFYAEYVRVK